MSNVVLMRRQRNILDFSVGGGRLPVTLAEKLEAQLVYTHLTALRGIEATDPDTGVYRPIRSDIVPLFSYDKQGRFVCSRGFETRVRDEIVRNGFQIEEKSFDQPHPRPDRFEWDFDRVFERMQLRARQDECLVNMVVNDMGVIVAPTGFGKSYLFAAVCLMWPKAKIHIITKRRDVSKRLYRHLTKYVPNVGQIGGGKNRWGRVTVITADSLHKVDHTPLNEADVVLYDEVHEAMAPSYIEQLARYERARMYGFTATPDGRFDNAHYRMEGLFGRRIFEMTYQQAVDLDLVVPVKVEWLMIAMDRNPCADMSDSQKERWGVWRNDYRNQKIAEKAASFDPDEQVLILVRTVEHAIHLKQHLPGFKLCYDKMDPAEYQGHLRNRLLDEHDEPLMTSARRDKMQEDFEAGTLKKVIATDVWSTGVDFPQLAVLIRADARSSEIIDIQGPGRVVRKHDASGKSFGLVVDCHDSFDGTFLRRAHGRRRSYRGQGWEQQLPAGVRRVKGLPATATPTEGEDTDDNESEDEAVEAAVA